MNRKHELIERLEAVVSELLDRLDTAASTNNAAGASEWAAAVNDVVGALAELAEAPEA